MTLGMFMAILDIQIVASSIIDIQFALNIPSEHLSYIQTTYLIAEVIAIAMTGWLTRVLSTRWLFVAAMIGFVLASAGCAAAQTYEALYAWRVVQGLFGGADHSAGFHVGLSALPTAQPGARNRDWRRLRHAGADRRPLRRRLDHRDLLLALAVPDQPRAGDRWRGRGLAAAARDGVIRARRAAST